MPLPTDAYEPKEVLYVRIPARLKDLLDRLARDNSRSLSSTVTIVLNKGLGKEENQVLYERVVDES